MLIIFDLDDTLVDTSGCLTHYKLEQALLKMVQQGLALPDFHTALEQLRRLNAVAPSSQVALSEFIEILGVDPKFLNIGVAVMYPAHLCDLELRPLEGALDILRYLKARHTIALVTKGEEAVQREKLEKAGIDSHLFSKILITQEGSKKPLYGALLKETGIAPGATLVCGDRICPDLTPAKELGCRTVHMKWGRGMSAKLPHPDVDVSIGALCELKEIAGVSDGHE